MNPFTSPYGTLSEDHPFYYSDLLDIMNHEHDPSRRRQRLKVILHGSKSKQTRPLFQHDEAPTMWTSSLRTTLKRLVMTNQLQIGMEENFQMLVELGFVNHLLMFLTHSYRYLYKSKKYKHLNLPVDPENVDCFMYEKKALEEHSHYPVYAADILNYIMLSADIKTFKAIIERYFTEEQNGANSSKLINDGRHVVMNGVGVFYKVLKYGVVTQRDSVVGIIRTIVDKCMATRNDIPNFIIVNETYPLNTALLQYVKDYQNPETMWNEFNQEGFYQSDIYPSMDAEYNSDGANNARRWLMKALSKSVQTMIVLTLTGRRKGLRRKMFTQEMLFELLDLIDKFPHVDNFSTLISSVRTELITLFSLFLYDEEKLDLDGNMEKPFEIDYQLLDELSNFPIIERLCKMITRINYDPLYSLSNIKKLWAECEEADQNLEDTLSTVLQNIIEEEVTLVELLSWFSHNPIFALKIANYENGKLIDMLTNSTVIEKLIDDTNLNEYCSQISIRPSVARIIDEFNSVVHISIPRFGSSCVLLGNVLQALPQLNGRINGDGQFYSRYFACFLKAKKDINDLEVGSKSYFTATIGYKNSFVILSDILEENYSTPEAIRAERVTISSNMAEMAIRLNWKQYAQNYASYALKLDPNHEKSKRRLETIAKMKFLD